MDAVDRQLLNLLQTDFPLVPEPFAAMAERLGISEDEAIRRVRALKARGIIRQISAIFDSAALGYTSSLVAFSVPEDRTLEAGGIVSAHPGVSHNYERDHAYNLWFTITVPPGTDFQAEVDRLAAQAKPRAVMVLPTIRVFKIGARFDMNAEWGPEAPDGPSCGGRESPAHRSADAGARRSDVGGTPAPRPGPSGASGPRPHLSEHDIRAIRAIQRDLPIDHRPFAALAEREAITEDELLDHAREFLALGIMRRYAAVLRHREAGFKANAMAVWNVPEEQIEEAGRKMADHRAVSHCYQRPTYPDWPYSIFTMIHGRTRADCERAARELSAATGITDYALLYSKREFKKTRVEYYV